MIDVLLIIDNWPFCHWQVPPFGADILREVMVRRKREEMELQKMERARRIAYQEELDVRIFEEELQVCVYT
jgi:hypothetical protein